jgi:integration host factor subunit beta
MNKSDLIEMIAVKAQMPRKRAEEAVNLVFDMMSDTLAKGGRIEIRGFGSFVTRDYGTYRGRNPRTGESITVEPKKLPFFKVGKELKERVDGKPASSSSEPSPKSAISVHSNPLH